MSYLFEQEVCVVRRTRDEVLGQLEERLKQVQGKVLTRRLPQEVRNYEKASAGNDLGDEGGKCLLKPSCHFLFTHAVNACILPAIDTNRLLTKVKMQGPALLFQ